MAVRAPPTCRKPVGDGAKRTRTGPWIWMVMTSGVLSDGLSQTGEGGRKASKYHGPAPPGTAHATDLAPLRGGPSPPTPSPAPSHPPHRERETRLEVSCLSPSSPGEGGGRGREKRAGVMRAPTSPTPS